MSPELLNAFLEKTFTDWLIVKIDLDNFNFSYLKLS